MPGRWTNEQVRQGGGRGAAGKPIKNYMPSDNAPAAAAGSCRASSACHTGKEVRNEGSLIISTFPAVVVPLFN